MEFDGSLNGSTGVFARQFDRIGRVVQLGLASGRVISVSFPESAPADADTDHPLLDRIGAYLGGERDDFEDVGVALTLATDRRRVLEATRKIPYGETATVSQVVQLSGLNPDEPDDVETVRDALDENPTPLFIPDHRVEAKTATPEDVAETLRGIEGG
ncbi:methylated DNA-protein cysteine methyltransferase [Halalkaliarchaeum desulfuricum]|uniref:Methylated DNA-protein cysteine methyltransferase n=1 Tax=Halalkaliarchaeum desulfuricum TaxID=2055893 RepID=A0A343TFP3_9EURY|nr:MGMT family protein [Halalkaliarchaeum desulfuricum]AUX07915.1 methylated DNA-protein cysteine methyltransferase [Halalkaliarchaeum desulfuricum]